ncbi:MAG TPA: hypothetical protein DCY88_15445 [Cyanobacteria bacterium UBA11372]|nr:hypothetical protein [Cyanobacteria bacterium UBA11372]
MQPERQKRMIGYFIEEATTHLDTIEQGLVNLSSSIDKYSIVDDLLFAAHSLAGGAAMIGIDSISSICANLKSCFQPLQLESSVKFDLKLKKMFMQAFYGIKELVYHLNQSSELSDAKAIKVMSEIEITLAQIRDYMDGMGKRSLQNDLPTFLTDETLSMFDDFFLSR